MHRLTIPDTVTDPIPVKDGQSLQPGCSYLCSNRFVGQILTSQWHCILKNGENWPLRTLVKVTPWNEEPNFKYDDIWLFRGGGWGDLLMMTPTIRELNKKYPNKRIHVACADHMQYLFQGPGLEYVYLERIPLLEDNSRGRRAIVSYEEAVEGDPLATKIHIAEVFARKCGVELTNYRPIYTISKEESACANIRFPKNTDRKRVGIQFLASGLYRTYPSIANVMTELAKDYDVFLFGQPGQIKLKNPIENVTNLMDWELSFRESAAVLATCDICLAPDSALAHLSSALDIPCVAIYGPFPSALRISSDKVLVLEGKAPCAPCFYHAEGGSEFPVGMPCYTAGKCVALDSIPVDTVVQAVKSRVGIEPTRT